MNRTIDTDFETYYTNTLDLDSNIDNVAFDDDFYSFSADKMIFDERDFESSMETQYLDF